MLYGGQHLVDIQVNIFNKYGYG